jgi:hypothetical protein
MAVVPWDVAGLKVGGTEVITSGRVLQNITSAVVSEIRQATSDGADNSLLDLNGGGAGGITRGARVLLGGNEHATIPGWVSIQAGNVAGAIIQWQMEAAEKMRLQAGILRIGTTAAGNATAGGIKAVGVSEMASIKLTVNEALLVVTSAGTNKRAVLGDSSVPYIWFDVDVVGNRFGGSLMVGNPTGGAPLASGGHVNIQGGYRCNDVQIGYYNGTRVEYGEGKFLVDNSAPALADGDTAMWVNRQASAAQSVERVKWKAGNTLGAGDKVLVIG